MLKDGRDEKRSSIILIIINIKNNVCLSNDKKSKGTISNDLDINFQKLR